MKYESLYQRHGARVRKLVNYNNYVSMEIGRTTSFYSERKFVCLLANEMKELDNFRVELEIK